MEEERKEDDKKQEEEKKEEQPKEDISRISTSDRQLYKLECITDSQLVAIDMLVPISISQSGKISIDKDKPRKFIGKTHVMAMGQLTPYSFQMTGIKNAREAIDKFDTIMDKELDKTRQRIAIEQEKAKQQQREQQSQIIVPQGDTSKIVQP